MTNDEVQECKGILDRMADLHVRQEAREMVNRLTPFELACLAIIARDESIKAWADLDRLRALLN